MPKIEKEATINAPEKKVFAYLSDPKKMLEWLPGSTDIRNVTGQGKGCKWGWTYKMAGIPYKGEGEYIEYVPDSRCVTQTSGGIASKWIWELKGEGKSTDLKLTVEYETPGKVGKVAAPLVTRQNRREATLALKNIKDHLES